MQGTFVPTMPELVRYLIDQLKPNKDGSTWRLSAAACSEQLFWMKLGTDNGEQHMMLGLPTHVAQYVLPQLDEASVREAWNEPEAFLTDLEQLSRSLPSGNHKLVIAPVQTPFYGEIRVTASY
ncbi:hypothetical protein ACFFK0_12060 [Paenibacillus chartarius]|uniref:Uncharacterized protein n=1 Tax=Paenibacillus chartarius TaxID=747481 RepID=A0ABV6DKL2_9BACL